MDEQREVIDLLRSPAAHAGAPVECIDTHASVVFLAGDRALKLKRAVRYDYLDFSTPDLRQRFCEAEVRLNRRTAPDLYRGVLAVTRTPDGTLAVGGPGEPVDWVVEMRRFPQEALLDRLAAAGRLDLDLMPSLGRTIAAFHGTAQPRRDHGGTAGMSWVVDGNAAGFAKHGAACLDPAQVCRVVEDSRAELARLSDLLDGRRQEGLVRHCHGDLHLRNIVLVDGTPTLFDGVEFNDEIACIDVLYDLAFLLMDLWRRRLPRHANAVWNRYLAESGDLRGVPLLPLFLSCRAAVRAKTSATAVGVQADPSRRRELQDLAGEYLRLAGELLRPPRPSIVAIGGFSGSGKSTLALSIASSLGPVPGAVVLRSDEIRKRLCGVDFSQPLDAAAYSPATSSRVYGTIVERAATIARGGHAVVVDAVFARAADRQFLEGAAAVARVPFAGLWLDAPEPALVSRVATRRTDPSDADAAVVRRQMAEGAAGVTWHRIDASGTQEVVWQQAMTRLEGEGVAARN